MSVEVQQPVNGVSVEVQHPVSGVSVEVQLPVSGVSVEVGSAATGAPAPATPRRGVRARLSAVPLTLRALVVSRILVLGAGIAGVLTLHSHILPVQVSQTEGLGSVGQLLAASVDRFDSSYYLQIATHGYAAPAPGRIAFLPLYPELIRAVGIVTGSPVIAGALISLASFTTALLLLHRLTERELGRPAADATSLLLCFAPLSFFFTAVYTESLFLALTVGTFYAARTGHWRIACAVAALATLTRPTGIALIGPLLVIGWRAPARRRELAWLGLVPAALVAWMVTLALLGHGLTGEFHVEHTQWHRLSVLPPEGLLLGLVGIFRGASGLLHGATIYHPTIEGPFSVDFQNVWLGLILVGCLVALEGCRRRLPPEYAVYAGLVLLVCLSSPEQSEPLWCFDRFALTIFPLWMVTGSLLARRPRLLVAVCLLGAAALVFYTMQFASWAFVA